MMERTTESSGSNFSETNKKIVCLLEACNKLGVDFTLVRSAKSNVTMIHIRLQEEVDASETIPVIGEVVEEPSSSQALSAPIEVPREFANGAKTTLQAAINQRHGGIYLRSHTSKSIQVIDRKWSYPEVMKIVFLRRKANAGTREYDHSKKVMSDLLGVDDITKESPSYKEIITMISLAEGKNFADKFRYIVENFHLGYRKVESDKSLYFTYSKIQRFIASSEIGKKFLDGEKVDLNFSMRYFIDAANINEVQQ